MCAYEALWLNDGAWFTKLAALFRENPGAVPSELVDKHELERACTEISKVLGQRIGEFGIRVNGAGEYPAKLRDADHPIEVLYFQGNWELVDTPCVAIVGTRTPSVEGESNARRISNSLSRAGFTIVSGLAKGVDTAVHEEAIRAGGRTIAVIGTPLFEAYPKENSELQQMIAKEHLLISQVPFLRYLKQPFKANTLFFPARNVTMSALTQATVIVEAGNTSGTLVQAKAALAQNRKLFILESCFRNPSLTWPQKFEQQGAVRVQNVTQIIEALQEDAPVED